MYVCMDVCTYVSIVLHVYVQIHFYAHMAVYVQIAMYDWLSLYECKILYNFNEKLGFDTCIQFCLENKNSFWLSKPSAKATS